MNPSSQRLPRRWCCGLMASSSRRVAALVDPAGAYINGSRSRSRSTIRITRRMPRSPTPAAEVGAFQTLQARIERSRELISRFTADLRQDARELMAHQEMSLSTTSGPVKARLISFRFRRAQVLEVTTEGRSLMLLSGYLRDDPHRLEQIIAEQLAWEISGMYPPASLS